MAGAGKKTFTAGEILTASDTNTYLMEQTVMYFAGTAARASAIPTPSTGMTSYIGVTGTATIPQLETYTGSAWQTPYGLTLINNTSFTTQTAVNFSNVFSSAYTAYKVLIQVKGSTSLTLSARFRENTTDKSNGGYYGASGIAAFGGQFQIGDAFNNTNQFTLRTLSTDTSLMSLDISRPSATTANLTGTLFDIPNGQAVFIGIGNGGMSAFNGFSLYVTTGTFTGSVKIYGYRES